MLQKGQSVPLFTLRTIAGEERSYSPIWQHRHLVLVVLPPEGAAFEEAYLRELAEREPDIRSSEAELIVTRDAVQGFPAPGVLVADRWGEIAHAVSGDGVELPPVAELMDWLRYLQIKCPECEGEAR